MAVLVAVAITLETMPVAASGIYGARTDLPDHASFVSVAKTARSISNGKTEAAHAKTVQTDASAENDPDTGNQTSIPNRYLEAAKERYENAQAKYNLGSAGFFQYRMDNAKNEDEYEAAKLALAIINDKTGETQLSGTVNLGPYTDPSKDYDAANLENMKAALEMIAQSNELRTTDESVAGIAPMQVSDVLMAQSQKNVNYADLTDAHPYTYGGGENLAVVTGDPFIPWFHDEKAGFEKYLEDPNYDPDVAGDRYGHYLNITEEANTLTGFAISKDPAITDGRTADIQRFGGFSYGTDYAEYMTAFMTYYNSVVNELKDAKTAYEDASRPVNTNLDYTLLDLLIESCDQTDASIFKADGLVSWNAQLNSAISVRIGAETQDEIDKATRGLHEKWLDLRLNPASVPLF